MFGGRRGPRLKQLVLTHKVFLVFLCAWCPHVFVGLSVGWLVSVTYGRGYGESLGASSRCVLSTATEQGQGRLVGFVLEDLRNMIPNDNEMIMEGDSW